MTTKALPLLCLAVSLAAPIAAQTIESAKSASEIKSVSVPEISNVCFGRGQLVADTMDSIGKAEKGVAGKLISVGDGVEMVMQNAAEGNGQCVAKTVLGYLRDRGDIASSLTIEDNGKAVSILLSTNGGPVLFKGASESGAYAFQVLTYRLQRIAQPAEQSGSGACGQASGKDADQRSRSCALMRAASKIDVLELLPAPVQHFYDQDARGGKDADQMSSDRNDDPHE
jgi:hypothetical protein